MVLTQVDQVCCIPASNPVKVDLSAGPARPLVTHLPEVVLAAKRQHALRRQEAQPDGLGVVICGQALLLITTKVGGIQPFAGQLVNLERAAQGSG